MLEHVRDRSREATVAVEQRGRLGDRPPAVQVPLGIEREVHADVLAAVVGGRAAGPRAGDHEGGRRARSVAEGLVHAGIGRLRAAEVVAVDDEEAVVALIPEALGEDRHVTQRSGPNHQPAGSPGPRPPAARSVGCAPMARYGITIPYDRAPLGEQRELIEEIAALGYTDVWSAEASATDGFVPLAMASAWVPELRLGTAIVPSFTRGPATLAMSVATMAEVAPGRFQFGLGTSSDVIVERWNGIPFTEPYKRNRDMVRFLKAALAGEKVTEDYDTFSVKGFRLERPAGRSFLRSSLPPCARVCCASPAASVTARSQLALGGGRQADRPRGRARQGGRGPDFRLPDRGCRSRALGGEDARRRILERRGVRAVPAVARPRAAAAGDVGPLEGGRPQGRRGVGAGLGRRRARRARDARPSARPTCSATSPTASRFRSLCRFRSG